MRCPLKVAAFIINPRALPGAEFALESVGQSAQKDLMCTDYLNNNRVGWQTQCMWWDPEEGTCAVALKSKRQKLEK